MIEHPYKYVTIEKAKSFNSKEFQDSGLDNDSYMASIALDLGEYLDIVADYQDRVLTDSRYTSQERIKDTLNKCTWSWRAAVIAQTLTDEVVGVGILGDSAGDNVMSLSISYVAEAHRRKGIYKQLLQRRLDIAKRLGADAVDLVPRKEKTQVEYLISQGFEIEYLDDDKIDFIYKKLLK